jgi:hypothetical protein
MFLTFHKLNTTNDSYNRDAQGYLSNDNVIRRMVALGKTCKESIDGAGHDLPVEEAGSQWSASVRPASSQATAHGERA